jgi:hypothetical protein
MPVTVDAEFSSALRTVLVEASTASWEFWFGLLEQFKEAEGHCNVPRGFCLDGFNLSRWISNQRSRKNLLDTNCINRLNDVGFVWNLRIAAWEQGLSNLLEFMEAEGHCRVPHGYKLNGVDLGSWVLSQRQKKSKLSPNQRQKLDVIGFVWDPLAASWEEGFAKLVSYSEHNGHCNVPAKFLFEGYPLGNWVGVQRSGKDSLSNNRIQQLEELGFVWDAREKHWEEAIDKLISFEKQYGHCNVPNNHIVDNFSLGKWVGTQRKNKDSLPQNRKQQLDDIGFVWDPLAARWEEGFAKLVFYLEHNGHCKVPQTFKLEGFNLGTWVSNRRKTKASMSPERKQQLDDIGFIWDTSKDKT